MEKNVVWIEGAADLSLTRVGDDDCLIQTKEGKLLLSYDAAFELAVALAKFIHCTSDVRFQDRAN